MISVNSAHFSCLYDDVEKKTLDLVPYFFLKQKIKGEKIIHSVLWKQGMRAAFVQAFGLCCEIRHQLECAVHNLKLTSDIRQQWKSYF